MKSHHPIFLWLRARLGFLWALVVFLLGYLLLLVGVVHFYLVPAYAAMSQAEPAESAQLRAWSALLLAILLAVLAVGLLLTFRLRHYFVAGGPSSRTEYSDAWSESGRRARR